jgi:hypothetical protein
MDQEKVSTISSETLQYILIGCSVGLYMELPYVEYVAQPVAWFLCFLIAIGTIAISGTALALYANTELLRAAKTENPKSINTPYALTKGTIAILATLVMGLQLTTIAPILSSVLVGCSLAQVYSSIVARIMIYKVKQWSN